MMARATIAILVVLLAGCRAGYTVDVRNETSEPSTVHLFQDEPVASDPMLASAWLGPGERLRLGPVDVRATTGVYIQADARDNPGYPATFHLQPGLTVLRLKQPDDDVRGSLRFHVVGHEH